MSGDRRTRAGELLAAALERDTSERNAFIDRECSDDVELRGEVEDLLAEHARTGPFDRLHGDIQDLSASTEGDQLPRLTRALTGRYAVERQLGEGGMATVYLARDLRHDRNVAIKALKPGLTAALGAERFLREIKITAQLNHPHILPLLDSGVANGFLYYVMPYVEGESLRDRLNREQQLSVDHTLQITREVADALESAHRHNVIHRDIKPENILLQEGHAVVADFGIAHAVSEAGGEQLTQTGIAIGTPYYMSPEQSSGERHVDRRSDVYSLACVVYEMLAGHPPFTGRTAQEILARHSKDVVPSLSAARPAVAPGLEHAIATALAKTPADRFATASRFAEAVARQEAAAAPARATAPITAHGLKRLALFGVPGVLVIAAFLLVLGRRGESTVPAEPTYDRAAIAVLPFQNLSAEGPHAYFAGGLHDELLTQLSKVAALKVIGRSSVMGYAGTNTPFGQIASELAVGSIAEGTVQAVDGQLRVNVQLIDAATEAVLWAERYDGTLDDAFAIQSDIAQQIVGAVGATLSDVQEQSLAETPTANAEAYRFYLQGQDYFARPGRRRQDWEIAQQLYEQAIALDSNFALAHAALSEVHGWMHVVRYDPSPTRFVRQREEAVAALRLAPDLPQAHLAMGLVHYLGRRDYPSALEQFAIALEGAPNDAWLWQLIGAVHRRAGDWDEVVTAFERARELNPRDANMWWDLGGNTYSFLGRYAEAVRAYDQALMLAPDMHHAAITKGWAYVFWQGQLDTLRAVVDRLPADPGLWRDRVTGLRLQGFLLERNADSVLQLLEVTRTPVFESQNFFEPSELHAAWAHQLRGNRQAARAAFDSALVLVDSVILELPDDWRLHVARGLALAGLGRRAEALSESRWVQQSIEYREDAMTGPFLAIQRARILAQAGEADLAVDVLEIVRAGSSPFSVHMLRLDPIWDPIREHPRFQRLVARPTPNP